MAHTQTQNQLLAAKDLAEMLSVSVRTIWRLRSAGKLPKPVSIGGSIRWKLSDIELWQNLECPDQKTFEIRKGA
ncbi:MAG TPA: helix-turn-helix domain-containing protein [Sedimentisphaerales bacterium]|nr:helix-turn-helix domain-containing protein [Sedimentisphaerales bacterium]